jgi:hypothetical protein
MAALPDDEKIELFGRALYGDAWIGRLTERERWLLKNYERWVDPPMIAVGEAINGGTNHYAGGITWIDVEYDERIRMVRGRWLALPNDPALAREIEEAVNRRDRMEDQRSEVLRQLRNGAAFPPPVRQGGGRSRPLRNIPQHWSICAKRFAKVTVWRKSAESSYENRQKLSKAVQRGRAPNNASENRVPQVPSLAMIGRI